MKYFRMARFKMVPAVCGYCGRNLGQVSDTGRRSKICSGCRKTITFDHGVFAGWR